jgi:PTS system nitrogen regulatory IIA component
MTAVTLEPQTFAVFLCAKEYGLAMNSFAQFLFPENILLGLNTPDKMQTFAHIASLLERQHQISRTLVFEGLCAREQLGSTGLGEGVAIPHAQINGLRRPMTAFVRLTAPIDFDAPDQKPVSEMFVVLVPVNRSYEHLQMLADIAEMLCDSLFRERLGGATEIQAVQQLFQHWTRESLSKK